MEAQPKPLLKYAEELLRSYSRLIVYSGDILRALPEPREGLSAANFKTKKDESVAFSREWQHLESVLDEYLIRLNDIRTRAHEELDAARVRCLAGADVDLTLPEAVAKLTSRLSRYKRQYDVLQKVTGGCSLEDVAEAAALDLDTDLAADGSDKAMEVEPTAATQSTQPEPTELPAAPSVEAPVAVDTIHSSAPEAPALIASAPSETQPAMGSHDAPSEPPAQPRSQTNSQPESIIDIDDDDEDDEDNALFEGSPNAADDEPVELGSDSDIDDDAMEDIFDS
ncbi:hypothetical protein H4S02_002753 [Coemansia sp. RSA 2611]|nr:hypothetical protein LPJ70_003018 [Coemansia sp. RSA 2708]KAJ2308576.1 hypothetical protein IWW54_004041 [Coemansia sp. RSA 2705]KAJ2388677.1 hypothetical protein H4S02_002753 [Coemansia sp. RSA 2611]KAJ2737726.1 hypothetical protein H4R23_001639 [Coemansia sp. Cherry 401B]